MQLPHRPPFLFVDKAIEIKPGISAYCRKIFDAADPMFQGHFPGNPLVPGVLLTEALAQTAGLILKPRRLDGYFLLAAIQRMKFPASAHPGDSIDLFSTLTTNMENLHRFRVWAKVAEKVVAEGEVVLSEF
ncbi:MAG: 3-hydroxyacyl-[acyl-carrier-protein] dehydratase FabZ [Verrucomicrobia bacterium]|nr:MAG: 3-hydroxyacyl-[acyl-carrier-protein] dehydratase FabZ [Verrucomicrobiota bacterium]